MAKISEQEDGRKRTRNCDQADKLSAKKKVLKSRGVMAGRVARSQTATPPLLPKEGRDLSAVATMAQSAMNGLPSGLDITVKTRLLTAKHSTAQIQHRLEGHKILGPSQQGVCERLRD